MSKKIVILLLVIFIGGLLFPSLTLAGEYQGYNNKTIKYQGLVPCGRSSYISGVESPEVMLSCQFCHLFVMLDGIIDFITQKIVPPIVILMMIIAGIMFFFAGGNPTLLLQAKKLITSVAIGLLIIFSAYLIIGTILTVAGVQSWTTLDKWLSEGVFIVDCPIEVGGDGTSGNGGGGGVGDNGSPVDVGNSGKLVENDNDICIGVKDTATCEDNEELNKGECIPGENTHIKPGESGITDDGKGWTCVFQGDEISPVPLPPAGTCYPPTGVIYLDCIDDSGSQIVYEGIYSDPNTSGELVTKTKECEGSDEIATDGECIPVDDSKTVVTSEGISDNNKGYTCTFRGKSENINLNTFYSPEVIIKVYCEIE